jgi:hypothetical protein
MLSECNDKVTEAPSLPQLSEGFTLDKDNLPTFKDLLQKVCDSNSNFQFNTYRGGSKERTLIARDGKIVVPKSLVVSPVTSRELVS